MQKEIHIKLVKIDENSIQFQTLLNLQKLLFSKHDTFDTEGGAGFGASEDVFSLLEPTSVLELTLC